MRTWGKKRTDGFRSGFEAKIAASLTELGVPFSYETVQLRLEKSLVGARCTNCNSKKIVKGVSYKPDFIIKERFVVEAKGRMTSKDRKTIDAFSKIALSKGYFYFILLQRDNKLSKTSKTKYSDWLAARGITYAVGSVVPPEWYQETP